MVLLHFMNGNKRKRAVCLFLIITGMFTTTNIKKSYLSVMHQVA